MSKRSLTLLLLMVTSVTALNTPAQQLITRPDSAQSLSESWDWAANQNVEAHWVAYRFTTELDERLTVAISSRDHDFIEWNQVRRNYWFGNWPLNSPGWHNSFSIGALVSGASSMQQDLPQRKSILVLARYRLGEVVEYQAVEAERFVEWQNQPIYWLGDVSGEESFRHLLDLLNSTSQAEFQRALIKSIGLHNSNDRDSYLLALLNDTGEADVQAAILEALAMQESAAVESELLSVAADENAQVLLRRISLSALSRYNSAASEQLLLQLAGSLNPLPVRLEAIQSLALRPSPAAIDMLSGIIADDRNSTIVEQALVGLARQPDQFDTIADAARSHADADVREEALELLTSMNASAAFPVLKEIVMTDSNPYVREEAMEEMDAIPADLALPFLFEVTDAADAYDIDLRAEAVDTLSSFEPSLVIDQLNRLAWGDSDEEVRENAVQGLGYLETQNANSLLLEIARNHPSSDTRSEAMQVLEDLVF